MSNSKFQNAIKREPQAVPPVWFMRQAGRYHNHYQKLRARHSFMEMCKDPKLAAQVALGPIQDFDFDVSILFSDLLFPLEAMGMGLKYDPAPELGWHLTGETMKKLRPANEAIRELEFQREAVRETRRILPNTKSLIGFVGGPFTLFAYAVDGSHKGGLEKTKRELRLYKPFCEILVPLLIQNIALQLDGGAEIVMLFDTAAGELSPTIYKELVVPTLAQLAHEFPNRLGYYAKTVQPAHLRDPLFQSKSFVGLGFDHRWDLTEALKGYRNGFVQGNFDQSLLFCDAPEFKRRFEQYLKPIQALSLEERAGWVSGLGHGVLPQTPEENVLNFVKLIREALA